MVLADILSPKTCGISEIALRCRCCSCRPVPVAAHQTNELIDRLSVEQPVSGLRSEVNTELNFPPKLRGARSRLYRRRFLQVNTRWKALAEIYTMDSFAPFAVFADEHEEAGAVEESALATLRMSWYRETHFFSCFYVETHLHLSVVRVRK